MSETLDRLVSLLERASAVDEFVAVERDRRGAWLEVTGAGRAGPGHHRRWQDDRAAELVIYRDVRRGRGSARLRVAGQTPHAARLIEHAAEQAARSVEPAWSLPPPAAPARVDIADPDLAEGELMDTAERIRADLDSLAGGAAILRTRVEVTRDQVTVRTSRGFAHTYAATLLAVAADLAPAGAEPGVLQPVRLRSRRRADLDLEATLARAARRLGDRRRARPVTPGRHDVLLTEDALTPRQVIDIAPDLALHAALGRDLRPARFGWLAPLVAQADARLVRQGLARYRPGQSIYRGYRGHDPAGDPLTVRSDGAAPFGLLSQPVGDLGEPVRRFVLVERGVARGLALELREAALLGRTANGGVRNLRIDPGPAPLARLREPGERPVLEIVELAGLHIDSRTGAFMADVGLGYTGGDEGARRPVTGATLRGNVFELLAGARLSSEQVVSGWYRGPAGIRFSGVQVS